MWNRTVNLVVTEGTPVRSDYNFDMSHVGQGIALSSPNDMVQIIGGGAITTGLARLDEKGADLQIFLPHLVLLD